MKILFRILAALLFLIFFAFALKNTHPVSLNFYQNYGIQGPLALMLLCFFVTGAVLGVLAMTPTVFRYRRELNRQKRAAALMHQQAEEQRVLREAPPLPDTVS